MANSNRPSGLSPVKHISGAPFNGQGNIYCILAANLNGFAIGDPVASGGSADANGVPDITVYGGASVAVRGVILGLGTSEGGLFNPDNLNSTVRPAAAQAVNWYALVADDPDLIFEVQEKSGASQLVAASVGLNTILITGANNGFVSGWQLASITDGAAATTSTLPIRLLGLVRRADNAFGAYAKWLVKINVHELSGGLGSAGV